MEKSFKTVKGELATKNDEKNDKRALGTSTEKGLLPAQRSNVTSVSKSNGEEAFSFSSISTLDVTIWREVSWRDGSF